VDSLDPGDPVDVPVMPAEVVWYSAEGLAMAGPASHGIAAGPRTGSTPARPGMVDRLHRGAPQSLVILHDEAATGGCTRAGSATSHLWSSRSWR
jgi:hypothetical protein